MSRAKGKSILVSDGAARPHLRICEHPSCLLTGEFRAPRNRNKLNEYRWFCLEHVREYNRNWDYYAGMPPEEIEAHTRADTTWRRPSWPLGSRSRRKGAPLFDALNDPYGLFEEMDILGSKRQSRPKHDPSRPRNPLSSEERDALEVLELEWPVTMDAIKARYKTLAKQHHPDANGGDRDAEEKLKEINRAYSTLKSSAHLAVG